MTAPQPQSAKDTLGNRPGARPAVPLALAFMIGIVAARYFPVSLPLVIAILLLTLLVWVSWIRRVEHQRQNALHVPFLLAAFLLAGIGRMAFQQDEWSRMAQDTQDLSRMGRQSITGTVQETRTQSGGGGAALLLDNVVLEKWKRGRAYPSQVELYLRAEEAAGLSLGATVQFNASLAPIRGPSLPTSFDYQEHQYGQTIFAAAYLAPEESLHVSDAESHLAVSWIRGMAHRGVNRAAAALDGDDEESEYTLALVSSIAFGLRDAMPPRLRDMLAESGLAHITSISGLHVTLVLWLLFYSLKRAGFRRRNAAWITALIAVGFVLMVGARIPVLRSVLMAYVLLGKHLTQRRVDTFNSLALAALALLLLNPAGLFTASFQLSFTAVLALLLSAPLCRWIDERARFTPVSWLCQGVVSSLAVVVALAPFTIHYFNMVSWGAALGNLLAVPALFLFLPFSYAWAVSLELPFEGLSHALQLCVAGLAAVLMYTIRFFSETLPMWMTAPDLGVVRSALFLLAALFLSKPMALVWVWGETALRNHHIGLALAALAVWSPLVMDARNPLRMDFLSLGQSDCVFVQTPGGKTILIDGGAPTRSDSPYRFTRLEQYLLAQGVARIDAMILTHPQADHIGDLLSAAKRFPVGMFVEGVADEGSARYAELSKWIDQASTRRKSVTAGDRINLGDGTTLWILSPRNHAKLANENINEYSVVLLLEYKNFRALLTGDIGMKTERELCDMYGDWDVDVMKIPHHGSRYSSSRELLGETLPEYAVAMAGRNPYGHPHPEARQRYYDIASHVLRTDYDGTIRLRTHGENWTIYATRANRLYRHDERRLP